MQHMCIDLGVCNRTNIVSLQKLVTHRQIGPVLNYTLSLLCDVFLEFQGWSTRLGEDSCARKST